MKKQKPDWTLVLFTVVFFPFAIWTIIEDAVWGTRPTPENRKWVQ